MTEYELMMIVRGTLKEVAKHPKYFYEGYNASTSHLTSEGEAVVLGTINLVMPHLVAAIHNEELERSKKLVIDGLKS